MSTPLPAIVNALPGGYLDLLGLKTMGRNPSAVTDFVQPILDLSKFYLSSQAVVLSASTTANTPGSWFFGGNFDVPQNEVWALLDIGVYSNALIASEAAQISLVVDFPSSGNVPMFIGDPGVRSTAAGHRPGAAKNRDVVMLPPGSRLGFFAHELTTAGVITFQGNARVVRLSV